MFIAYENMGNEFHYLGEFTTKESAIKFAKNQTSRVAVAEHREFADSPIVYTNY